MWGRIGRFFRATAAQQRGMIVLVVLLLVLVGAVAVKDGRREIPRVEVLPADSTFERSAFRTDTLFYFDPSSADSSDFVLLGFSPAQVRTILRFRTAVGGRFSSPEQFSQCYAVSDSMFARLLPYIRTQELQEEETVRDFSRVDLNRASLKRLQAHAALDEALAEKLFQGRIRYGGFVDADQLCGIFAADSAALRRFSRYADFDTTALVRYDVNQDSERLLAEHPYISRLFARSIVEYRSRRGSVPCYDTLRGLKYFPHSKDKYLRFYLNFDTLKTER